MSWMHPCCAPAMPLTYCCCWCCCYMFHQTQETALHKAFASLTALKLLLRAGCDPKLVDKVWRGAIESPPTRLQVVGCASQVPGCGPHPEAWLDLFAQDGSTVLHAIAAHNKPKAVPILLAAGAPIDAQRKVVRACTLLLRLPVGVTRC